MTEPSIGELHRELTEVLARLDQEPGNLELQRRRALLRMWLATATARSRARQPAPPPADTGRPVQLALFESHKPGRQRRPDRSREGAKVSSGSPSLH